MSHIGNLLLSAGLATGPSGPERLLKTGFPAGDFWASLGISLLVLAALIQGGFYLRRLTREKREP